MLHDLDISQRRYALGVVMLQPVGTLIEEDNHLDFHARPLGRQVDRSVAFLESQKQLRATKSFKIVFHAKQNLLDYLLILYIYSLSGYSFESDWRQVCE